MGWLNVISDIFSVITISLCFILKVPQIICLIKSGKASGLSTKSLLLELSSYTVTMLYNYTNNHAILSYLEYPIIVFQEYILIGLVFHLKNFKPTWFLLVLFIYGGITLGFAYRIFNKGILSFLLPLTIPAGASSKVIQLVQIISTKNAESVSILTWFLSFFTNVTRIYTVYMDSGDMSLLLNFLISSALSGSVMMAALYFQRYSYKKSQ